MSPVLPGLAVTRLRVNIERRAAPAAAMAGSLSAAGNPYTCSGKSSFGAVPLPQLRTHSPGGAVDR